MGGGWSNDRFRIYPPILHKKPKEEDVIVQVLCRNDYI